MTIITGDCLIEMAKMPENSIDFVITDPPYGLYFMGKDWDNSIPSMGYWQEALRICKPGSMLAAFAASRTHHHLMIAIESAGWEIRDVIMWIYGSGFPKSHNHFGIPGYGTALKPAYEPIILAMKPLDGTFAQNAEKWGVAGINIDDSRIETVESYIRDRRNDETRNNKTTCYSKGIRSALSESHPNGRWPANIILDEEAAEQLDQMSGISKGGNRNQQIKTIRGNGVGKNVFSGMTKSPNDYPDSGGASRFFYCAKASSRERNEGLEGMPMKKSSKLGDGIRSNVGNGEPGETYSEDREARNFHPTVKPISLMKYIIKLLAPPGNPTLLDPFAGSGSTLVAAIELGINSIGIELSEEYSDIARKRIEHAKKKHVQYDMFEKSEVKHASGSA